MARPKQSLETLKVIQVNIRVTLNEQLQLEQQAKSYGISVVEFVRRRALNKQLPKYKIAPVNRELLITISRCGNNLNQLTKLSHLKQSNMNVLEEELKTLTDLLNTIKTDLLS